MKKLTLVLALLVSFGLVGAFAQTITPVVDFSADAEAVFGIDLNDEMSTGFTNSASAELSITWIDEETWENEGDDVYGWIQIEDIDFSLTADESASDAATASIGDITARIYFSPAYLQIASAPGFTFNNAESLRLEAATDNNPVSTTVNGKSIAIDALSTGGVTLGVEGIADMMDVAFKLGSVGSYKKGAAEGTNTANEYVFGLDVNVAPMDMLTVDFGMVMSSVADSGLGFTLNPVLTMGMLEAGLPLDLFYGQLASIDDEVYYELAPYVTYDLNEAGSNVGLWAFFSASTYVPTPAQNATLDLKVSFDEVADGFVPGLETGLAFFAFDVLDSADASNDIALGLTFNASYAVGDVKPFVDVKWASKAGTLLDDTLDAAMLMDDTTTFVSDTDVLTLEAGVELTMVENTTFTIKYASDNLADDTQVHTSTGATGTDAGRITFAAKVAY